MRLINQYPNYFDIPKRTTTKKPSQNEEENKNYYFVAREKFFQVKPNKIIFIKWRKIK